MTRQQCTDALTQAMFQWNHGNPKRCQHSLKVHAFAAMMGREEGLSENEQFILESAAILHDVGILAAETAVGHANGKLQEIYGPSVAREMMKQLSYEDAVMDRVAYLVGHHHTYTDIDGIDYQILIEADFLVNLYEDASDAETIRHAVRKIFRTKSGNSLAQKLFDITDGWLYTDK